MSSTLELANALATNGHREVSTASPADALSSRESAANLNIHDLSHATSRLRAVTDRIDSFLTGQLQRLADAMYVYTQVKTEAETVRRLYADLESDRQQWQVQRDAELERLNDASDNLIEAWRQLDDAQRQWALDRRRNDSTRSATGVEGEVAGHGVSERTVPGTKLPEQLESTLLEIQLLKRELLGHAHRRK